MIPNQRKIVEDYRDMIENENRRVNERLTVFCQFQGLLVTALALGWGKRNGLELTGLTAGLGFCSAIVQGRGLYGAVRAIDLLYEEYLKLPKNIRAFAGPVVGKIPHPDQAFVPSRARAFLTPSMILPGLMLGAWLCIGVFNFLIPSGYFILELMFLSS
jgi:hypothetical protein